MVCKTTLVNHFILPSAVAALLFSFHIRTETGNIWDAAAPSPVHRETGAERSLYAFCGVVSVLPFHRDKLMRIIELLTIYGFRPVTPAPQ